MILIKNIKCDLNDNNLVQEIQQKLKYNKDFSYTIVKEAVDARKKGHIFLVYQILVDLEYENLSSTVKEDLDITNYVKTEKPIIVGTDKMQFSPVIVGSGPSGLITAYYLSLYGLKPILIERGKRVEERSLDVYKFWKDGILNPESNVQFGEGGAGTFSDGKLTTRVKDERIQNILKILVKNGADKEILYKQKPHIGTDALRGIVKNIREEIIKNGGQVLFDSKMADFEIIDGQIKSITVNNKKIETKHLILAIGHSARDTFRLIYKKGVSIENKPFAVGFRIEHKQIEINKSQYKTEYLNPRLGSAEYQLAFNSKKFGKGVYTFCMCPGGVVVSACSQDEMLVVNGMSYQARSLENANSAVIATVSEEDFGTLPLAGMYFQEEIEKKAFILGGSNYNAPVQKLSDFLDNIKSTELGSITPTYKPSYKLTNLNGLYSDKITDAIKEGIVNMDNKLKGFSTSDAILTGVETRSSSPIRIKRDKETMESINTKGLFPIGEGSGYAGGIISSAIDGLKLAELIISRYNRVES